MVHIPADYLFTASVWGFYELLKLRLRTKPDPLVMRSRLQRLSALQLVCEYGCLDLTELLLDWGWGLETNDSQLLLGFAINGPSVMNGDQSLLSLTIENNDLRL